MDNNLLSIMGLILVVIAVMTNAYWQDAVRWEQQRVKALIVEDDELAKEAEKYSDRAISVFKVAAFLGMMLVFSLIIILLKPDSVVVNKTAKFILLLILFLLTAALVYYVIARKEGYLSPVGWKSEHLNKVVSMERKLSGLSPR